MGLWDKILGRTDPDPDPVDSGTSGREPNIDRPTHTVRYTDADGKSVELQTYSGVAAEMIKEQHPDAVIKPTTHQ